MFQPQHGQARYLIVSASMGSGHDGVASELARRLSAAGAHAGTVDLLDLLPAGGDVVLRGVYRAMLRWAPGSYRGVYRRMCDPARAERMVEPVARHVEAPFARLVDRYRPDAVLSTFHLAAVVAGRLRRSGVLGCPSLVAISEFAPHPLWLAPGNDAYLCPSPRACRQAAAVVGDRAHWLGPVVAPAFDCAGADRSGRLVLLSAGSWGVSHRLAETTRALRDNGRYWPLALCGRNQALRRRVARLAGPAHAAGWIEDMPSLLSGAFALVDNSGGLTCMEAFRAEVPVIAYRPLPGHGEAAARQLALDGFVSVAGDTGELLSTLDGLREPGRRAERTAHARALFGPDPAGLIDELTARHSGVGRSGVPVKVRRWPG